MAEPTLRVVRSPKGGRAAGGVPRRRALTAASQAVTDTRQAFKTTIGAGSPTEWQTEAWDMVDLVGELRYPMEWIAASCSRVEIIASELDPDTGLPTGGLPKTDKGELTAEAKKVAAVVRLVGGGPMGLKEILRRVGECYTVPGEYWIAIVYRPELPPQGGWFVLTRQQINNRGDGSCELELTDGTKHEYNPSQDSLIRVWRSRPRRAKEPDSPVRAALDPLREIVRTTKRIKQADRSRMIGNGVVFLPQEMSLPSTRTPVAADQPGATMPVVSGVPAADELANLLYQAAVAASEDEDSQAALIPLMATVPGEFLQKIFKLDIGNDVTELAIKTRNDAITRLALALNISPERLLGIGTNSNHWSAWQIGDEDVQTHIKPIIEAFCAAVTEKVFALALPRIGIDPSKYVLWYDASGLTEDPDKSEDATTAAERGAMNHEALMRRLGFGEDEGYDLTTIEGMQQWARDAVAQDPTLITQLLPLMIPEVQSLDFPTPQPALPPGQDEQNPNDQQPADQSEPNTEQDQQDNAAASTRPPTAMELALAERMLVTRALELAGKRRVRANDRDQMARLRGIAAHEYHRYMPPVTAAEIPKLITGWDSALEDETMRLLGVDTDGLRNAVLARVRRELTAPLVEAG